MGCCFARVKGEFEGSGVVAGQIWCFCGVGVDQGYWVVFVLKITTKNFQVSV